MKTHMPNKYVIIFLLALSQAAVAQKSSAFRIGRLKYAGGGDWYVFPLEEPTLLKFIGSHTNINVDPNFYPVKMSDNEMFTFPFLFLTGHGNVLFTRGDAARLRTYLEDGGFLYANDSYGMGPAFPRELKKVFPHRALVQLPYSYGIYHCVYNFPDGPPEIENWGDGKHPDGWGLFIGKRLAVYYSSEGDPPDGWDPTEVHGDPESKHIEAMEFGTNLVYWALTH
jgi:hypothetical protein